MDELKKNPYTAFEDKIDFEVPTCTLAIYKGIEKRALEAGQSIEVNRASSANLCPRRRWYQRLRTPGAPLTPRKRINFTLGDLTEAVTTYFINQDLVGPGKLYSEVDFGEPEASLEMKGVKIETYKQLEFNTKIGDLNIVGHPDGLGKRNSDGKWELIEIKSAANYGFKEFKSEGPGTYLKQAHVLMASEECKKLGVTQVRFIYLRKETGSLWDGLFKYDDRIFTHTAQEFKEVMEEEPPARPYPLIPEMKGYGKYKKPSGRTTCEWQCGYCPYIEKCQGKFTVEFKKDQWGSHKPVYIFDDTND
jgi:hypothetical protein